MDCERLDEISVELAYGELEPRRLAEAEQHLLACERCTALVARLRKGREAAALLELEDPSSMLEARILAVAGTEKPPASIPRRTGRWLARAGAWVTRPQFAMAAVLVLMVGSSVMLLRGGGTSTARKEKTVDEGKPIAQVEQPDPNQAAAPAAAVPKTESKPAESKADEPTKAEAKEPPKDFGKKGGDGKEAEEQDDLANADGNAKEKAKAKDKADSLEGAKKAGAVGGLAVAPAAPAGAPAPTQAPGGGPATTTVTKAATQYDSAMAAYKEARWADAAVGFDAAAAGGDRTPSALLYAGRSQRALGSCDKALVRFQKVVAAYPASADAPWAALEGGQCAKQQGDLATARALFEKAKASPATAAKAQAELDALSNANTAPKAAKPAKPSADQSF